MKKTAVVLLALVLGGCAGKLPGLDALTSASVSPTLVIVAANSFDAVEATATNYLTLKKCTPTNGPVCRDLAITKRIIPAVRTGRAARNTLEQFLKDHPGQLGPRGAYDALIAATATLQAVVPQFVAR